ncbi:MAG: cyclopropane-fatty-acyl-phospholipid synthase [Gammaproteobacteria bacterium]
MNDSTLVRSALRAAAPRANGLTSLGRRLVLRALQQLHTGTLTLLEGPARHRFGHGLPQIELTVHHPSFYADLAFGGSIGAAEAYMGGAWSCNDLTGLTRLMVLNQDVLDSMEGGFAAIATPLRRTLHWLNRNSRTGSRRNIGAHYDLGNDFFRLMLDDTMTYSCGIFLTPQSTLREASLAKLAAICRKLDLQPRDHVLEIGTGWGSFAIYAAKHHGCRVTTTTLSRNQYELARERIAAAGLSDRITVLLEDYRDLTGSYDKLVSIEMIEAVGHQYFDTYFARCARLLRPEGQMLLQAITIVDQRYESARRSVDFIQRYVFPGCTIPSVTNMLASITRASDMKLFHMEDIGPHYATTLRRWRGNFSANIDAVRAMGHSEGFIRMWEFYLCYCEGGFAERALGDVQMLLVKPGCRRASTRC